jgi:plasmid stability protein
MNIRTQLYLPEVLHQRLKARARLLSRSMADQVREAVERYLAAEEVARPDDPVWRLPQHAVDIKDGPHNLAVRHDGYLYGASTRKKPAGQLGRKKRPSGR